MDRSQGQSHQPAQQPARQQATQPVTTANPLSAQPGAQPLNVPRSNPEERAHATDLSHGITKDEKGALDRFTGPAYKELNRALRSGGKLSDEQWEDVQLLGAALEKLPKCKGFTNRILKFVDEGSKSAFLDHFGTPLPHRQYATRDLMGELDKQAKSPPAGSKEYVTPQFMSCKAGAMDQGVASFSSLEQQKLEVRMKVLCTEKHAGDLRKLYEGIDLGEQEVLFPPGTKFHVIAASESNVLLAEMDSPQEPLDPSRKP